MSDKDYLIKGDMYQYNLGWLIQELLSFKQDLATAIDLKTIKYADPIQWDITTQYPANTVVVDPKSGTAYMSKVPVPAGVELTNDNYWVVVFNYQDIYNKIMDSVAFNDRDQDYATKDLLVNDLVWYAGDLYRVTREITTGSKYIPGTNLIKTSIESLLAHYYGRDRTAQVSNDTVNVSGDYTLSAGNIAETSTNRTVKVTKDREVDVNGSDSVHVDGESTLNVGGMRTEIYAGDKTEGVTGVYTGKFGSASFETGAPSWKVKFPTKAVDLADIDKTLYIDVTRHGVLNDGSDVSAKIAELIKLYPQHVLFFPDGTYGVSSPIQIDNDISKRVCIELSSFATIKALDSFVGGFLIDLYYKGTSDVINIGQSDLESFGIRGGFYNCNNRCSGIHLGKTHDTYICNVNIYKCTTYGIKIDDPYDYPSADAWLFDVIIRGYADKTIGLYVNSGDNNICRLRTWDTNIGIWTNRGFNTFNHIHVLCSAYENLSKAKYEKTVGIVLNGGDCYNNVFTDCYADNFNTGIHCVSCGHNTFTRLFVLCGDTSFATKKIGILVDDFFRLTINSFTFSTKQSGAVSVSVPNYSWFNTGDLTSFGYIDHRFLIEGDTAKLDIYNDASMFSPFNRIYDYNIGDSGQVANTYRLIAVVRASNIPYSLKINGYSISCDINIMIDVGNTFKLNSIKTYLDRNPTSKIAIGLIGEHFGRNLYGIYIVSSGSAFYNIKFDYLAADQLAMIPPRAIANYNNDFKDKQSINVLFSHDLVNYPN